MQESSRYESEERGAASSLEVMRHTDTAWSKPSLHGQRPEANYIIECAL